MFHIHMRDTQGKMSNSQRVDLEFRLNYHLQPNHKKKKKRYGVGGRKWKRNKEREDKGG